MSLAPTGWRRVCLAAVLASVVVGVLPAAGSPIGYRDTAWQWGSPLPQGDDLTATGVAGGRWYAGGPDAGLLRSDDGGVTWVKATNRAPIGEDPDEFQVIDRNRIVVQEFDTLKRSDDGGRSFRPLRLRLPTGSFVTGFTFESAALGFVASSDRTVYATVDGGRTFARRGELPAAGGGLESPASLDLVFSSPRHGIAVGGFVTREQRQNSVGVVYRTSDGGRTWSLQERIEGDRLLSVDFPNPSTGFAVGTDNLVLRTDDAGATWSRGRLGGEPRGNLQSLDCSSPTACVVFRDYGGPFGSGDQNRLIHSIDGLRTGSDLERSDVLAAVTDPGGRLLAVGRGGVTLASDGASALRELSRRGVAAGRLQRTSDGAVFDFDGLLSRSLDGGRSWTTSVPPGYVSVPGPFSFVDRSSGFVVYEGSGRARGPRRSRLLRTDDGGSTWRRVASRPARDFGALVAVDRRRLIAAGRSGVRRSGDGGETFRRVKSRAVGRATLTDFERAGRAVFAYGGRRLAVSTDAGRRWRRLRTPRGAPLRSVDFVDGRQGFAVTTGNDLFRTATGGRSWRRVPGVGANSVYDVSFGGPRRGLVDISYEPLDGTGENTDPGAARVMATSDGGSTWRLQELDNDGPVSSLVALGGPRGVIDIGTGLIWTRSGGDGAVRSHLSLRAERRRLAAPRRVRLRGTLRPSRAGDRVSVSYVRGGKASFRNERVGPGGRFEAAFNVKRSGFFVAHRAGDAGQSGAGTRPIRVVVERQDRRR